MSENYYYYYYVHSGSRVNIIQLVNSNSCAHSGSKVNIMQHVDSVAVSIEVQGSILYSTWIV